MKKCLVCDKLFRIITTKKYCSKECYKEFIKKVWSYEYRRRNRIRILNYSRKWRKDNLKQARQSNRKWTYKYQKEHPEIHNARQYAWKNKQRHTKCKKCKSTGNLQFHHTNYVKRKGFTLCANHHRELHNKQRGLTSI